MFLWSVFIMSGATLGMGLVPTYAQWGVAASVLMVTLRLIQGFCLGGELPGALTYVVETAPRIAPFVCGVVFACVTHGRGGGDRRQPVGAHVPGSRDGPALRLAHRLHPRRPRRRAELRAAAIARRIAGVRAACSGLASRQPFRELLRTHCRQVLIGCALLAGTGCFNGLFFSHLPAYLSVVLKYDPRQAVFSQTVGVIASALGILLTGWLGDRIPPRYLLRAGVALLLVFASCRSTARSKRAR